MQKGNFAYDNNVCNNVLSLRKFQAKKAAESDDRKKRLKKLKVFVKRATLKVKIQNGTLRKLHKKIIMYERLIQKVRDMSKVIFTFRDGIKNSFRRERKTNHASPDTAEK